MSVRVVARIRPLLEKELDKDTIVRADSTDEGKPATLVKIPNPKNEGEEFSFAFNSVYDQATTQDELFTSEVAPHIKALFQGLDVTIFAYGVTGTGKTHTMRGGLKLADRGVIPRLLSGVYRRGKKITKDTNGETTVDVALSYYEIYNDKVFDLFEPPEKRQPSGLPLREKDGKTMVVGLSERACEDLHDFSRLYIEANNNRVTAATKLNAHSSRSHAIMRVKVTQTTGDQVLESTASAIDLAGSEDNRRTDNGKERLVESAAINKSLFVLSQCIDAISRGDKRIPYRESKMTRILSLGQNNGITIMILNLAPIRSYHLDTLSSLNVSSRAKRIEVREIENEVVFKQVPRTNSAGSAMAQRQPLRPLPNAHNIHSGTIASKANEKADVTRPVKLFNVYTDRSKNTVPARPTANTTQLRKPLVAPKVTKIAQPSQAPQPAQQKLSISAEQLEAIVEKKVSEILASRESKTAEPVPTPSHPDINDAVRRRLEALERRIESEERERDDTRSEGLRCLLAARQAKEAGNDVMALQMYEQALPFFPGQAKLLGKIEKLRSKLGNKLPAESAWAPALSRDKHEKKRRRISDESDDEFHQEASANEDMSFVDVSAKTKSRKAKPTKNHNMVFPEVTGPASPQTQNLLNIVNSRDIAQIKGLHGFGSKKAQDLVDYLDTRSEEGGAQIESLAQLKTVPGMGGRTVERAYDGLVGAV
ncbi:Putative kinesin-like protein [Colletotrichum destructivum]|uniref:Kinesin-like protein n=1 Tax=Colletotrichum destructivum TaxID=34406 RepID=A0AAX4I6A6_9PEZI|nr:Putative kinesin-like protein [Colletotrichum destructivum]